MLGIAGALKFFDKWATTLGATFFHTNFITKTYSTKRGACQKKHTLAWVASGGAGY
jgi:hypothetical protein